MTTIKQTLSNARERLADNSDSPQADAEILLAFVLDCDRSFFHTWPELTLEPDQALKFETLLERRLLGEPIAHIIGTRSFWDFDLKVTADTLIPRPETELLVEQALSKIPTDEKQKILDLGTGTGAIALAIAHERPLCEVTAVEQSSTAREIARQNQARLQINNLKIIEGDWFTPVMHEKFELIVSNPPYVASDDPHLKSGDVRFEPKTALESGTDGLDDIRHIISHAQASLAPHGWLMLEHGYDQAAPVRQLLEQYHYKKIQQFQDLGNQPRLSTGQA